MVKGFTFDLNEASGAVGDLGTLLPLMLAAVMLGGLSPAPVLLGFAAFYVFTALVYRLPVPVQPMKAIVAVMLVTQLPPAAVAMSGVLIGVVLLLLGATGLIDRIVRLVPRSVVAGLQLGLGLMLGLLALELLVEAPLAGILALASLLALMLFCRPSALMFVALAVMAGAAFGWQSVTTPAPTNPPESLFATAVLDLALPQLSLTLTNAILLTTIVMQDGFGERAARVTTRRLAVTSGLANLCLAPFGALPMCHGAGGAAAHRRFGARTGGAPLMIGLALAVLAFLPFGFQALALIPGAALGALLLVASADLAFSRRLLDAVPSCRPVIAVTALAVVLWNPLVGLIAGTLAEVVRKAVVRRLYAGNI